MEMAGRHGTEVVDPPISLPNCIRYFLLKGITLKEPWSAAVAED